MQAESGCCYLHCISSLTVWGAAWARWMIPARRRSLSPVPALGQLPGDGAEPAAGLWGWFPRALQGSGDGSRVMVAIPQHCRVYSQAAPDKSAWCWQ